MLDAGTDNGTAVTGRVRQPIPPVPRLIPALVVGNRRDTDLAPSKGR